MGRKSPRKKKNARNPQAITFSSPAEAKRRVERSLTEGATREALELCKAFWEAHPGASSERLLVRCYQARAGEFYARGQVREAEVIIRQTRARFPGQARHIGFSRFERSPRATASRVVASDPRVAGPADSGSATSLGSQGARVAFRRVNSD